MEYYKVIDRLWIRDKIQALFNPKDTYIRKLHEYKSFCNDGALGGIFFALEGTPPRGYALYNHYSKYLLVISPAGNTNMHRRVILNDVSDYEFEPDSNTT